MHYPGAGMTRRDAALLIRAAQELEDVAAMHWENGRPDLGRVAYRHAANIRRVVRRTLGA